VNPPRSVVLPVSSSSRHFQLILEYEGTDFQGWQIQPRGRTVQGVLQEVARAVFKQPVKIIAAGRTDRGVHALGQVAHFAVATRMSAGAVQSAFNAYLPDDVVVRDVREVSSRFHARYSAKAKVYRYTLLTQQWPRPRCRRFVWHYPHAVDVDRLRRAARVLVGEQDFRSFQSVDPARPERSRDTVRHVYRVDVWRQEACVHIEVEADGFLYKMMRAMVGTLLEVGRDDDPHKAMRRVLEARDRCRAGPTAPAQGLTLMRVLY